MKALFEGVLNGRIRALARLITLIENDETAAELSVTNLFSYSGRAHIIGVTGPPGSGKSTLVNELTKQLRARQARVAVIAVDPSSPFTGGALLGDRIRMHDLAGDKGVFIRSMASRGRLGGLARATWVVTMVVDAAGFDFILVETVGAGQAEVDIAEMAHTTLVVESPGMGDDIQSFKAGILEIADILVVNKADRPGADRVIRSLEAMLHLGPVGGTRHHGRLGAAAAAADPDPGSGWQIPVQRTSAIQAEGIEALVGLVFDHKKYLQESGDWFKRERERCRREIDQLLRDRLLRQLNRAIPGAEKERVVTAVANRKSDPITAVDLLLYKEKHYD